VTRKRNVFPKQQNFNFLKFSISLSQYQINQKFLSKRKTVSRILKYFDLLKGKEASVVQNEF